jgi:Tfp pilus assembly protein PilF
MKQSNLPAIYRVVIFLVAGSCGCVQLPKLPELPTPKNLRAREQQRFDLGRLSERHNNLVEARHIYTNIVKRNPKHREAWHRLAVVASLEGKWAEAEDHYRRVAELGPMTPEILSDMGYTLYLQHRLPEAERLLRDALAVAPRHPSAANNLALVVGQQGRFDECYALFRQSNSEAQAEANVAYVLAQMGQPKLAQAHYSRSLGIDPNNRRAAEAFLQLAQLEGQGRPVAPVVDPNLKYPAAPGQMQMAAQVAQPSAPPPGMAPIAGAQLPPNNISAPFPYPPQAAAGAPSVQMPQFGNPGMGVAQPAAPTMAGNVNAAPNNVQPVAYFPGGSANVGVNTFPSQAQPAGQSPYPTTQIPTGYSMPNMVQPYYSPAPSAAPAAMPQRATPTYR